ESRLVDALDRVGDDELAVPLQHPPEVFAEEPLHHEERHTVVEGPHVEGAHDVIALEGGVELRLAHEPRDGLRLVPRLRVEHLQGDHLPELLVARREHGAHASHAEEPLHAVLARDELTDARQTAFPSQRRTKVLLPLTHGESSPSRGPEHSPRAIPDQSTLTNREPGTCRGRRGGRSRSTPATPAEPLLRS